MRIILLGVVIGLAACSPDQGGVANANCANVSGYEPSKLGSMSPEVRELKKKQYDFCVEQTVGRNN